MNTMGPMELGYFTQDTSFPFFIQYGFHDADVDMHEHADFCELVIVLSGTAMHCVNDESYFIRKGDVFVLGDGVYHGYHDAKKLCICNIMFRPEHFILGEQDIRKLPGYHALFVIEPYLTRNHEFQSHLSLKLQDYEDIYSLINTMLSEYQSQTPGRKTMLSAYFLMLVTKLSRLYQLPSKTTESKILYIAESVSYIETHFRESITIEEIAKISNLSPRHFSRLFQASYHTSPGNYILSLRMECACRLLKQSTYTISEIAFESGFNDSNYFSRQFHKFYEMSPRDYRNRHS